MHNDTSLELYNIKILYNLYIVQALSCPNLPLKIPQTSINKGRKTSWRLGVLLTGDSPLVSTLHLCAGMDTRLQGHRTKCVEGEIISQVLLFVNHLTVLYPKGIQMNTFMQGKDGIADGGVVCQSEVLL